METNKTTRWTVAKIKAANLAAGGKLFSRGNMKFMGDTMRSFGVINKEGRVFLKRRVANKPSAPYSVWEFNPVTGRLRLM